MLEAYPLLRGRGRFKESNRSFVFALSSDNLRRLSEQLRKISVKSGQEYIDALYDRQCDFLSQLRKARAVKSMTTLPDYDYKVPPLAEYQHRGCVYLTNVKPGVMFADCGTGKTWIVINSTEQQIKKGMIERGKTLVCVKLATIKHGWLADTAKFSDLKAVSVWALPGKKRRDKLLKLLDEPADFYVINHDGVRLLTKELAAKGFQKVVVDESTILKTYRGPRGRTSAFGKALEQVSAKASYRVIMSGTPAPNDADDLWGQMKFVDPDGFLLGASFKDFKASYMKDIRLGKPNDPNAKVKPVMTISGRSAVRDALTPLVYRVKLRDHIRDMPAKLVMSRSLPMTPEQARHYDEMEDSLATLIDDELVVVSVMLAALSKLRQITGGFLLDVDGKAHSIKDNPKMKMMDDLLRDEIAGDEKVVIFAQHRYEIEAIEERFSDLGVGTVYGGNTAAGKVKAIDDFLNDPKVRLLILHPKSAAHGITLTVARYMIFYSFGYSNEDDYQAVRRIERASQKREMRVYYLLCEDSIDEVMFDTVAVKALAQSQLLDNDEADKDVDRLWKNLKGALKRKRSERRKKRVRQNAV